MRAKRGIVGLWIGAALLELAAGCGHADGAAAPGPDAGADGAVGYCWEGDYVIDGALDAQLFAPYPCIEGTLTLSGLDETVVVELPNLAEVRDGDLVITGCSSLAGLSLPALTSVEWTLEINGNSFAEIAGLPALAAVREVSVLGNPGLASLQGLAALAATTDVTIAENAALPSLAGLEGLTAIGDPGDTYGGVYVSDNAALTSLAGLDNVAAIRGQLRLVDNPVLSDLSALSALEEISFMLDVEECPALESLAGLEGLSSIGRADPDYGGGIWLGPDAALADITALAGVTDFAGAIVIADCPALASLEGLGGIGDGDIVTGIEIFGADALVDLAGLETAVPYDYVTIASNAALTTLDGLTVDPDLGNVEIDLNPALASVAALAGVETIWGSLWILHNDALIGVAGLEGLAAIDGDLQIDANAELAALDGLAGLTTVGGRVEVRDNPALPTCEATELVGQLSPYPEEICVQGDLADECDPIPYDC